MPECPECRREIDCLRCISTPLALEMLEIIDDKPSYTKKAEDRYKGMYMCPKCEKTLFSLHIHAVKFLRGRLRIAKPEG